MQVGTLAIQHLFEKDILYRVPLYQRPYVWGQEEQWQPLWEDLCRLADAILAGTTPRAHFLGATVQDRVTMPPGQIETRLLIDGQQRLTTLQILLKAFHDLAVARSAPLYAAAIGKLFLNDHPLSTEAHQRFKVHPTNADRADFRAVMETSDAAALARTYGARSDAHGVGRTIVDAYLFFTRVIGGWIDAGPAETRIAALYGAIRDNARLVVIDLDEKDDAQLIFETLNARGTPLLAADLVKNALLSAFDNAGEAEAAYEAFWQPFDDDSGFWRAMTGRGHAQRARIELFLQHALTIMAHQDVAASHLYAAFRDYAEAPGAPPPLDTMRTLHRYGAIYRRIMAGEGSARTRLFLDRLATMQFATAYPFLIKLFDRLGSQDDALERVLLDVESFLVRRLVTRWSTRGYNRLFVDLLDALDGPITGIPLAVRAKLLAGSAEVDRWPDDETFGTAWRSNPLYENLTRPRLRLLLEAMEGGLRNDLTETLAVPRNLTVEHILPQTWQPHWPLEPDAPPSAVDDRGALLHTIGNLTLLNDKLNPLQSNYPWLSPDGDLPGKRDGLRANSTLFLNKALADRPDWNDAAIRDRGNELLALALHIWPLPEWA